MMKTTIKLLALAFALFATACSNDDEYDMLNSLWRNVTQNEARIDDLEKWCAQTNTNITSLQTIVNVIESNDAITSITPVMEGGVEVGYTITFADHDPITIYHGKDGKDGQNGANGQNGTSPIVGVAKYTDGVYYWTLNGEWLLDADGNKLPVSGKDGANGENGQNGSNGQNGVTPQLKIENDYWWISYDNGNTWTQLGKAKGEDGENGQNGAKGDKGDTGDKGDKGDKGDAGDSMFQSVAQDADNVYFTLANGTVITIAKGGGGADDGGYIFTITYMPNGGEGEVVVDTVFYADSCVVRNPKHDITKENYYFTIWNTEPDGNGVDFKIGRTIKFVTRNIVLYAKWEKCLDSANAPEWVDLGLPSGLKWATCNLGAATPELAGGFYVWGMTVPLTIMDFTYERYSSLPSYRDAVTVNWGGKWRMPSREEWTELYDECEWSSTSNYEGTGKRGKIATGPNGNSIFLPEVGSCSYDSTDKKFNYYYDKNYTDGRYFNYITASYSENATGSIKYRYHYFSFYHHGTTFSSVDGFGALPIRGVCE